MLTQTPSSSSRLCMILRYRRTFLAYTPSGPGDIWRTYRVDEEASDDRAPLAPLCFVRVDLLKVAGDQGEITTSPIAQNVGRTEVGDVHPSEQMLCRQVIRERVQEGMEVM